MFERQQDRFSYFRPSRLGQRGEYGRSTIAVTEQVLERCDPNMGLWKLARRIDTGEEGVDAGAPTQVVLLPDDVQSRRDKPARGAKKCVLQALVQIRCSQIG